MTKRYKDLRDVLKKIEKEFKDEVGFLFKVKGDIVSIKYDQFVKDVKSLGEYLLSLDLKNNRIAFISPNRYEWEVTYMATACSDLICVPLDRSLPENEFRSLLERSQAEVLVYDKKYSETIEKFKEEKSINVKYYVCMDSDFVPALEKGTEIAKSKNAKFDKVKIQSDKMRIMLFTSGTTAQAKCVMLSHKNICAQLYGISFLYPITKEDIYLSFLPLHHTFECSTGFLYGISVGAKRAYCEGLRHFVDNIKDFNVTCFVTVPAIMEGVYKNIMKGVQKNKKLWQLKAALKASDALKRIGIDLRTKFFKDVHEKIGESLRFVVCGGAPLNPEVSKALNDLGIIVYQGYGLTETSPVICAECDKYSRLGSVGKHLEGVRVKIDKPNEDGIGEIITKSDSVMLGYFDDKEATNKVIKNGWFYTGDLGRMDEDGYLYITGRKKDVIILKNGKNVYPDELEMLLNKLPGIAESFVYGAPQEDGDINLYCKLVYSKKEVEEICGNKEGEELREFYWNLIKNEVNKKMPQYKYIKNVIITDEPLIKTTTNKVKRQEELKKVLS
jgi:long-chain acyl-CoA synthetase